MPTQSLGQPLGEVRWHQITPGSNTSFVETVEQTDNAAVQDVAWTPTSSAYTNGTFVAVGKELYSANAPRGLPSTVFPYVPPAHFYPPGSLPIWASPPTTHN